MTGLYNDIIYSASKTLKNIIVFLLIIPTWHRTVTCLSSTNDKSSYLSFLFWHVIPPRDHHSPPHSHRGQSRRVLDALPFSPTGGELSSNMNASLVLTAWLSVRQPDSSLVPHGLTERSSLVFVFVHLHFTVSVKPQQGRRNTIIQLRMRMFS